jgi:hypothetical protein
VAAAVGGETVAERSADAVDVAAIAVAVPRVAAVEVRTIDVAVFIAAVAPRGVCVGGSVARAAAVGVAVVLGIC